MFLCKKVVFLSINNLKTNIMKKLLLLCFVFVLSNTILAQETETKTAKKAKTAKTTANKVDAKLKEEAKAKSTKTKTVANKADAKVKDESDKAKSVTKKTKKDANDKVNNASDKGIEKSASGKTKAASNKVDAKVKEESSKAKTTAASKVAKKERETSEKANPKDKIIGKYNDKKVFQGPRGGKYYINKNGNKTYIDDDKLIIK